MTSADSGCAPGPIRIGVLYSRSGVTSAAELTQLQATMLAAEEINLAGGVLGREVELVCLDPQCQPRRYADLAEQLILEHRVRIIVGCYMSSTRKAVIPIVERHNALLFYATPYEGFEYSRNVIYTGAAPNQNTLPLAGFMLTHYGSRVSMIGSDYVCPYESNRVMSDLILERGGEKVDETYLPLDARWESYLEAARRIRRLAPDFIFSTVVGEGIPHLYRAFAHVGLDPYRMPIASHMTSEAEIAIMGAGVAEGHITSAAYFQSIDTQANRLAVARYQARFGGDQATNMCWEAAYFQMHLLADAMRRVASDDPTLLLRVLPGLEFDAPQGRVRIDEHNNHTYLHPLIGRVNAEGRFDIIGRAPERVKADPYVVSHRTPRWTTDARPDLARSGGAR
ncbi:Urea ABC transporter, urea binding protein [Caballeronia glathei]|jgi:branched-chain amino acid transport system substrate-binding protein|uniref:transporter substrate-binding domain-containing protein n=1 Tax=Caballeronia glathei TaxID=60547 RepID=UPI000501C791|nr:MULTISPECIES: transporter substrate-binding domain-containing protein [Burkholderiaceae]TCK34970.1 amino acid/amide ABC transporter substrate-binding protein (HAAT family) [Paraburkholderia sp. BL8N3]CDY76823.1 Urea ABC transporter, urea binding protein [Caballeronia glathei]